MKNKRCSFVSRGAITKFLVYSFHSYIRGINKSGPNDDPNDSPEEVSPDLFACYVFYAYIYAL